MNGILKKDVVNDVTTKKKYVSPEMEVIYLDEEPRLLSASNYGAGFQGIGRGNWDDED
ncbi:MAG: hypothetical protein J6T96_15840 [Bacteroidales bacterium]|nr:hypothetical protein [Bacteroidales bacterium]MBO7565890.1 hypothetical protein [Bacteroidales bacterium]